MFTRISTLVARAGSGAAVASLLVAGLGVSHASLNLATKSSRADTAAVQQNYMLAAAGSETSRHADSYHGLGGGGA